MMKSLRLFTVLSTLLVSSAFACIFRKKTHVKANRDESKSKDMKQHLPPHLEKYRKFYDSFGYPAETCEDNSHSFQFEATNSEKIYGSKRAAVIYNPGCLNGANWRVCGLDSSGRYETFSLNIFATKEHAVTWAKLNGYEFDVYDYEKSFESLSKMCV